MQHSISNPRRLDLHVDRLPCPPDALGIRLDLHPAMQRMPTTLQRRQLALRIRRRQQEICRIIVDVSYPTRYLSELRATRRFCTMMPRNDLPTIPERPNYQRMRRVETARQPDANRLNYILTGQRSWASVETRA
jgi:hypothetical protein